MITLDKRVDISGYFVEGSLDEMQQFSDRMKGCYQIIVQPFEPMLVDELKESFSYAAGPYTEVDTSEAITQKGELILETIVKPYAPDFPNQGEPYPGTSVKVTVFPELKYNSDHSFAYPQLTIVGVDKYVDPDSLIHWDRAHDDGLDF